MANLLIIGAGGFGRVIREICAESGIYEEISYLDDNANGENIAGKFCDYEKLKEKYEYAFAAVGNNPMRAQWCEKLKTAGYIVPNVIHPSAQISKSAALGMGTAVLQNAVICANAKIGDGVIVNCGAVIDHDCTVEHGAHICINAIVKSAAKVGEYVKLEAGEVADKDITA